MRELIVHEVLHGAVPCDGKAIGEVLVRSPWLPVGYYKDPERTRGVCVEQGRLTRFWTPDRFVFVAELPLTSAGKVNKAALRTRFASAT